MQTPGAEYFVYTLEYLEGNEGLLNEVSTLVSKLPTVGLSEVIGPFLGKAVQFLFVPEGSVNEHRKVKKLLKGITYTGVYVNEDEDLEVLNGTGSKEEYIKVYVDAPGKDSVPSELEHLASHPPMPLWLFHIVLYNLGIVSNQVFRGADELRGYLYDYFNLGGSDIYFRVASTRDRF